MHDQLDYYIQAVSHMRTDAGKGKYPATTRHRAPHKPILLLAILDLFEQDVITTNFVPLSSELADLFVQYWDLVMPPGQIIRLFLPFFHMKNDGFWHLIPYPGQNANLNAIQQIGGSKQLRETVSGGQFDSQLFELLLLKETRDILRITLIEEYFSEEIQPALVEQSNTNLDVHICSLNLIGQARQNQADIKPVPVPTRPPIRNPGFRKAVVSVYDHRCVLCGIRIVTFDRRTAAIAAHIIPWGTSYNDDPRNGLCLCPLCHWTFDVGLASITSQYRIRLSEQLRADDNMPGHISTLEDRPIFEPKEQALAPDIHALQWHMEEVFRR